MLMVWPPEGRASDMRRLSLLSRRSDLAILQAESATVWLRCDLETIFERIGADPSRPLASDRETMRELLEQRQPTYQQALLAVDGEGAAGPVVDRITESLRREGENR